MPCLATAALTLCSLPTWACTVCGVGQQGTEWAYVAMTGVLSLLPLALLGGIAFWLYRRSAAASTTAAPERERG